MTAPTQAPAGSASPHTTPPASGSNVVATVVIGLLIVLVVGLGIGLISMNSKLDDLQQQVANVDGSVSLVGGGGGATGNVDDACRMLGALAFKAGVDVPAVFTGQDSVGTCETAAEEGFHQAKTG